MPPVESEFPSSDPYPSEHFARVVSAVRDARHPTRIGPYTILEPVGEGGMGNVYRAEQRSPIHRIVAIKLIKLGMDTREVIARFESERQALAMMNHPNVARVFDAGATETGRPYFVMEYVPGEPITRFADDHELTVAQRLELLIQACDAVQHAHQKAIIHRDLKPSNILVTIENEKPVVKVIDFGVAKAISERLTEKTLFTQTGQLVGTPEYMAPEQADAAAPDVDTRSDVYSLGVVLYELLSGALPFDATSLRSEGYQSIQRIIRDVDPPRPSTRLSGLGIGAAEIARLRHTPLDALERQLKSELEWIPLKAMRKDRADRYATATELAEDIRNYLEHRPLRAGPESAMYRARKFLRRNKTGVVAASAMLLLLLGGIATTTWQATRAMRAERQTRAALNEATNANDSMQAVNDFLTQDLLGSAEPARTHGREMTVREAVDIAARDIDKRFPDRPLIEASVRTALAGTYDKLGRADLGLPHAQAAAALVQKSHLENTPTGLDASQILGELLASGGKLPDAESTIRATLEARRRVLGINHEDTVASQIALGRILQQRGNFVEAESLERDALDRSRRTLGETNPRTLAAQSAMVALLKAQGKLADAEKTAADALALCRRTLGDDHLQTIAAMEQDAYLLWRLKSSKEAETMMRKIVTDRTRIQGADHPDTITAEDSLASFLAEQGRIDEADAQESDALQRARRVMGNDHPTTLSLINNLGQLRQRQNKMDDAEALCREALAGNQRVLGADNPETLTVQMNLAFLLNRVGKSTEAEKLIRQVIDSQRRVLGSEHPVTLGGLTNLGGILFEQGKYSEAEPLFREALAGRRKVFGDVHPETLGAISNLGRTLEAEDRLGDAEPLFAELYRSSQSAQIPAHQAALFMSHWGETLAKLERYPDAEAPVREAIKRLTETNQARSSYMARQLQALADICDHTNRVGEAAQLRAQLLALQASTRPTTKP